MFRYDPNLPAAASSRRPELELSGSDKFSPPRRPEAFYSGSRVAVNQGSIAD